jgi:hypothetical protein
MSAGTGLQEEAGRPAEVVEALQRLVSDAEDLWNRVRA